MQAVKIRVDSVSKVFGSDPKAALARVEAGMDKTRLLEETDHVLGLHDINLEIRTGETFVIMGLSGSGKSTLIRHFNRLIEPTGGRILFDGEDILGYDEARLRTFRRRKMAMVFQRFALLPHRTVIENVMYGPLLDGMAKAAVRARAEAQIALVGLSGFEASYPAQLSGGMQQRVGLARALATDAEVLLMDEAFSALDPLIRNDMQMQLKDLQGRLGKTIVFITHDLDEALLLGDHIAILKDGTLRQVGTGADILRAPADDYVARFVRDVNRARILQCGALADATMIPLPGTPEIAAEATLEAAFAVFADGADCVAVRGSDGRITGALTPRKLMEALARS
ncbi:quaternary amine ABC transporter ATP-binding protein [Szabonella alba]|uniref:Quaternary amine transport ATP-binding protein n=1 Tax=Szabonella alba TaxID=2804194 RepID=A0A8K0VCC4_9RHOB|nr:betaine/proline/choline family ABC transporter ATP-binding protein [Szabonella alba]MBL4916555.1 betaine/proline/choline family ABC transporter ATP-binding protein [Szabonella alba]